MRMTNGRTYAKLAAIVLLQGVFQAHADDAVFTWKNQTKYAVKVTAIGGNRCVTNTGASPFQINRRSRGNIYISYDPACAANQSIRMEWSFITGPDETVTGTITYLQQSPNPNFYSAASVTVAFTGIEPDKPLFRVSCGSTNAYCYRKGTTMSAKARGPGATIGLLPEAAMVSELFGGTTRR